MFVNGWPTPAALLSKSNVGWRDSLLKILPSQDKSYVLLLATFSNFASLG
jgi:hypothetical protein